MTGSKNDKPITADNTKKEISTVASLGPKTIETPTGAVPITERAREKIAFMLVFGFIALLISSMLFTGTVDDAIKLIQTISSAVSGMVGAVLGYYYGSAGLKDTNPPNNE